MASLDEIKALAMELATDQGAYDSSATEVQRLATVVAERERIAAWLEQLGAGGLMSAYHDGLAADVRAGRAKPQGGG